MRVAVAALGERVSPPWWRTEFLTVAGIASMGMLFPRTGFWASARATAEAARDLHDARVAKHGRFHLFRLPIAQERAVASLTSSEDGTDAIRGVVEAGEEALRGALADLAGGSISAAGANGPVSLGCVNVSVTSHDVAAMAACYLGAFAGGTMVFPYLDVQPAAEA